MEDLIFRAATLEDTDSIIDIIRERMDWMDEVGLKQWNCTHYLEVYPREYIEAGIQNGDFYLMEQNGVVIAEMALFEKDGRWDDDPHYFYVHHLATRRGYLKAGERMLRFAQEHGKKRGKKGIRLDSAVDNDKLNAYYETLGYPAIDPFVEGEYEGIRRVKYLDMDIAFRTATADDLETLWEIEAECFPPNEMCERANFERRIKECPEHFLLITDRDSGCICGFIGDIYTEQAYLTDDMFTGSVKHDPQGRTMILLGLNVRAAYRKRGFAAMLMQRRLRLAKEEGIRRCVLTCHDYLIPYYEKFGYVCQGVSGSVLGGATWYDMVIAY